MTMATILAKSKVLLIITDSHCSNSTMIIKCIRRLPAIPSFKSTCGDRSRRRDKMSFAPLWKLRQLQQSMLKNGNAKNMTSKSRELYNKQKSTDKCVKSSS